MQRVVSVHMPGLEILFSDDLKALFGFQAFEDGVLGNASGNLAIIVIPSLGLKSVGINFIPKLFIRKRLKPFSDVRHVVEFEHVLRIPDLGFRVQDIFDGRW